MVAPCEWSGLFSLSQTGLSGHRPGLEREAPKPAVCIWAERIPDSARPAAWRQGRFSRRDRQATRALACPLPQPASLTAGPALPIRSRRARTGAMPCSPQGPQRYPSRSACRTPLPKALPEGRPQGPSRTRLPKLPKDLAQSACRTQRGQAPPLSTLEHRRAPQRAPSPCRPRLLAKPPPMCPRLPRAAQTSTSTASASRILGHADHAGCLAGG